MAYKIGILGAGKYGTALAWTLAKKQNQVSLWCRDPHASQNINQKHLNPKIAGEILLPESVKAESELNNWVQKYDAVLYCCPSSAFQETLDSLQKTAFFKSFDGFFVNCAKGFDLGSARLFHEVAESYFDKDFISNNYFCLSGPSFAQEIIRDLPTCVSLAGKNDRNLIKVQKIICNEKFRAYKNNDLIGTQIGGALKNVIAIAAGIAEGMEVGYNSRTALINFGFLEMKKLGVALGAQEETFSGLSGLGDLFLTCTGQLSRNRQYGLLRGKGLSSQEALKQINSTVEGIPTTEMLNKICREKKIKLPICEEIYKTIFKNKDPKEALDSLLGNPIRKEY